MIQDKVYPVEVHRIAAEMSMHAWNKAQGWVCFRLADGSPVDHTVYATRIEAVKAMRWNRDNVIYLEIQPDVMTLREADAVLKYARALHDAGFRIPSPEFDFDDSMPMFAEDRRKQIRHLASGGKK